MTDKSRRDRYFPRKREEPAQETLYRHLDSGSANEAQEPEKATQRGLKPTAEPGPIQTTVGDLFLSMIGESTLRITYENATIEGPLNNLQIEVHTENLYNGASGRQELVVGVNVDITLGSIILGGLGRNHKVEIIS